MRYEYAQVKLNKNNYAPPRTWRRSSPYRRLRTRAEQAPHPNYSHRVEQNHLKSWGLLVFEGESVHSSRGVIEDAGSVANERRELLRTIRVPRNLPPLTSACKPPPLKRRIRIHLCRFQRARLFAASPPEADHDAINSHHP